MSKELKSLKFKNLGADDQLKSLRFKSLGAEGELKSLKFKDLGTAKDLKSLKFKKDLGTSKDLKSLKFKNLGKVSPVNNQSSRILSDGIFSLTKLGSNFGSLGSTATASLPTEIKIALTILRSYFVFFNQ